MSKHTVLMRRTAAGPLGNFRAGTTAILDDANPAQWALVETGAAVDQGIIDEGEVYAVKALVRMNKADLISLSQTRGIDLELDAEGDTDWTKGQIAEAIVEQQEAREAAEGETAEAPGGEDAQQPPGERAEAPGGETREGSGGEGDGEGDGPPSAEDPPDRPRTGPLPRDRVQAPST